MVDVSARPLPGNPRPDYPRLLRSSGVEGRVLAQFVIDTAGRADMRTFRVLHADHSLFERAVREAVAGMRFTSAESGGKKVRVLVQQSFAFRIAAGKALTPPPPPPETSPASSAPETPSL